MARAVKQPRSYDSPLRREQAAATRLRILAAAQAAFERDGYAGTSMAAVAAGAGVALKTVYLAFGTKSALLRAVWHRALRGERDEVPVGEQDWFREVLDARDPREQLRLNMRNSRAVKERAGALLGVIAEAAAADPEAAELGRRIQREFHANQRAVVASLAERGALRDGLDVDTAADILWSLNHPSTYRLLVVERGWPGERYERWMADLLCAQLLGEPAAPASRSGRPRR
jgi:AcrR family transcriptional regulator